MSSLYAAREGVIAIKVESTYGSDPSPSVASNSRYVEEASLYGKRISIPRKGPSPYGGAYPPVAGPADCGYSAKVELIPTTIATVSTDRPLEDVFLISGGLIPTGSGTDPKIVTYALNASPRGASTSATIYGYAFNADDDDGWLTKVLGCRGGYTLEIDGENRWMYTTQGVGSSYSHTAIGASRSSTGLPDYDFDTAPVVGGSGSCIVKAITANETYPAGGRVVSFKETKSDAVIKRGICGQYAAQLPESPIVTAELVLAVQDAGDFDPWQYQGQAGATVALPDAVLVQIANTDTITFDADGTPTGSGNYILKRGHYYVTDVQVGEDGGEMVWTLSLVGAYTPSSGLAGEVPSDGVSALIYGTK